MYTLRKILSVIFGIALILPLLVAFENPVEIKVDGVDIEIDVEPEMKNNRVMVPLRVISENLGIKVQWSDFVVTLTKKDMNASLNLKNVQLMKNGKVVPLDSKPYIKEGRTMVPIRFIAETFGSEVQYENRTVLIKNEPLTINNIKVGALQKTGYMTMGSIVSQIKVHSYIQDIYTILLENKGEKVAATAHYSNRVNLDTPGSYYSGGPYEFLDQDGKVIKSFEIYNLVEAFPEELLEGYPKRLLYDVTDNQWFLFSTESEQQIYDVLNRAYDYGVDEIISNTVV